jgi:superoxide reductase
MLPNLRESPDRRNHAPVIDASASVKKGEPVAVIVSVGRDLPYPNSTPHHIRWLEVTFHPEGARFPFHVARVEFAAHVQCEFRTNRPGTILASSYCNIHGLCSSRQALGID